MKKSLFAMAAVTAFAGAAQAQSSVTVYGILDVGYLGSNVRGTTNAAAEKATTNTFATGAESSSRLGFKGTEDLGGGATAFFTLEQDVNVNSTSQNITNNRQAFVGLGKKGIGSGAIGMQYTPVHMAVGASDVGQTNNMPGNVIYPISSNTAANAASGNGSGIAYTVRVQNSLSFKSDKFAGFSVNAIYSANNKNSSQGATAGGTNNTTAWGIGADYTWNKLYVTAAFQNLKNESTTGQTAVTAATGTTIATLTDVSSNQSYAAATYDFGILKAYLQYVNRKDSSNNASSVYAKRTAQQIGVRSYITPKIEAWASVGNGKYAAYGTNPPTANFTGYQLGSNYYLSKRTNLYAIFGNTGTSSTTASQTSYNSNAYALGVRHTF
jgi:predicted porin